MLVALPPVEMYVLGLRPKPVTVDGLSAVVFRPRIIIVIRKIAVRLGAQFVLLMVFDLYSFDLNNIGLSDCGGGVEGWKKAKEKTGINELYAVLSLN